MPEGQPLSPAPAHAASRSLPLKRHLEGVYTQHFNRAMRTDGPLFRGRYRSIVVDADAYLLTVSRYIHPNPLEAGLVNELRGYPWSSLGATAPDAWLEQETIRSAISARPESSRAFVAGTFRWQCTRNAGYPQVG